MSQAQARMDAFAAARWALGKFWTKTSAACDIAKFASEHLPKTTQRRGGASTFFSRVHRFTPRRPAVRRAFAATRATHGSRAGSHAPGLQWAKQSGNRGHRMLKRTDGEKTSSHRLSQTRSLQSQSAHETDAVRGPVVTLGGQAADRRLQYGNYGNYVDAACFSCSHLVLTQRNKMS